MIEPINSGPEFALIFFQGADIPNTRYIDLTKQIQKKVANQKLWVCIPDVFFKLPLEFLADKAIKACFSDLEKAGFKLKSNIYIAGHSLGGIAASNWGLANPDKVVRIIQLGSFLERKMRNIEISIPTLMIGGELDGLSRITRFAEEFYHRVLNKDLDYVSKNIPIVVLEGVNHMNFASGEPSLFVKLRDLKSENTEEKSHDLITSVIQDFLTNNYENIKTKILETQKLLAPIIEAFELEGSVHFNRPDQTTCKEGYCSIGSDWAIKAQEIIADKEEYKAKGIDLQISNDFVILSSLPPLGKLYHPTLKKDVPTIAKIKTYSQCSWDILDKYMDGGVSPSSAKEIGVKMISKQCNLVIGLDHPKEETPFTVDTDFSWCSEISKHAIEWAMSKAAIKTKSRYNAFGQKLVLAPDNKVKDGFNFVYGILKYEEKDDQMVVTGNTMMSDIDAKPIPIFAPDGANCFHYCKLLSPARMIEWMYVDGLRKHYGI